MHMDRKRLLLAGLGAFACALPAFATTNISPVNKYTWAENVGWLNWRDANLGTQGANVGCLVLQGFVWGENVGWVNLGDGSPANGVAYANLDGADFGVNVDASGNLSGFAWSENCGWINFSGGALATPAQPARIDLSTRRLRGYAWGENIGWINLDDSTHYAALNPACAGDANFDGIVDFDDITQVLANWAAGYTPLGCDGAGDANLDGVVDFDDITEVIANWSVVCP